MTGKEVLPNNMDRECTPLCEAINTIEGLRTVESCCGHGKHPFHVWFRVGNLDYLPHLLYWLNGCHTGFYGWRCLVETDCGKSPVLFLIEGPEGEQAYREAKEIAEEILADDISLEEL